MLNFAKPFFIRKSRSTFVSTKQGTMKAVTFSSPASYPANRRGYNSYLKDLGINPKDQTTILFAAIPFEQFKTLDRRSIDEKIQEAASECERLYDVYQEAIKDGRQTDAAFAEAGWNRRSKEFVSLVRSKTY